MKKQNVAVDSPLAGILRKQGSVSSTSSPMSSPKGEVGVHFQPPPDLAQMLRRYRAKEGLAAGGKGGSMEELEGFITHIRNQRGAALVSWLQILQENIALLTPDVEKFVVEVLKINWATQEKPAVKAFSNFLANLATAHSFYIKHVMFMLVSHLIGRRPDDPEIENQVFAYAHESLQNLLRLAPLSSAVILQYAGERMPYLLIKNCHAHTSYLKNLTVLMSYIDDRADRENVFKIILDRLVQLDAHLPRLLDDDDEEEPEEEEEDEESELVSLMAEDESDSAVARRNLDRGMAVMFEFLETNEGTDAKRLYSEMLPAFESHVLPAYATGHVQFLVFKLLAMDARASGSKAKLTGSFLDWLWNKFTNPNTPSILRQSAAAYMASLIARAKFIPILLAKVTLERLVDWIHGYICAREDQPGGKKGDYMYVDLRAHGPFYAACQSALYIFAFRHDEFVSCDKLLRFLRGLNLSTIVTSRLNPLRVCLPSVVANFAAVSRKYQLVYCDAVIERNNRINLPVVGGLSSSGNLTGSSASAKPVLLDSFFPFDPYALKESEHYIAEEYRVYKGAVIGDGLSDEDDSGEEDEEKEVMPSVGEEDEEIAGAVPLTKRRRRMSSTSSLKNSSIISSLLFGTSPGFKQ